MTFTIAFVSGVTLTKWTRAWDERRSDVALEVIPTLESRQLIVLHERTADVSFVRLPIEIVSAAGEIASAAVEIASAAGASADPEAALVGPAATSVVNSPIDTTVLSVIRLYREVPVAVLPKEHPLAEAASVTTADLADETINVPTDDSTEAARNAVELVAAGVGVLLLPQSVARLHSRKDVVAIPVTDLPGTDIAIAWLAAETTPDVEEFVGIVRGRTAHSSRSTPTPAAEKPSKKSQKKSASSPSSPAHKQRARNAANARKRRSR